MTEIRIRGQNIDTEALTTDLEAALGEPVELVIEEPEHLTLTTPLEDPSAVQAVLDSFRPTEHRQFDQLVDRARQVWNGQGSFTQAQAQKILAGLVLLENRRR